MESKNTLERGLKLGLTAFVNAWVDGRHDDAMMQASGVQGALIILADERGLSSPMERAAFFGGER